MEKKIDIQLIESKANAVLEDVFGSVVHVPIPVPLNKILDKYSIDLAIGEFKDTDVAGAYDKKEKVIYIAEDEASGRKAFTIGHELGHFILHKEKSNEVFYRVQILEVTSEKKVEEQEANWFAASLLMPEKQLRHYFSITRDLGELGIVFGVSSTAVYYRLRNLSLLP